MGEDVNRFEYSFELRTDDARLQVIVGGTYPGKTFRKTTLCRRIKRMVGAGLVVKYEIPCGRRSIIQDWKKRLLRNADECRAQIQAKIEKADHHI